MYFVYDIQVCIGFGSDEQKKCDIQFVAKIFAPLSLRNNKVETVYNF